MSVTSLINWIGLLVAIYEIQTGRPQIRKFVSFQRAIPHFYNDNLEQFLLLTRLPVFLESDFPLTPC